MADTIYNEILTLSHSHISYEESNKGHIKMSHKLVPLSIKRAEFEYIKNLIVTYNLQRGFEIGTAFGVSTLAAAIGFHATGGELISMDAYVEEHYEDAGLYRNRGIEIFTESDGYQSANFLLQHFEVRKSVHLRYGWSPRDVPHHINDTFGNSGLDFVFIDAGHFPEQIIQDVRTIAPFLRDEFAVVFHDVYETFEPIYGEIESLLGVKLEVVIPYPLGENLGIATTYAIDSPSR